jgi:hypothetical protein
LRTKLLRGYQQTIALMRQRVLHCLAQVLDQVKTVSDLFRCWRSGASTIAIDTVPIPADDPHLRMFAQPFRKGSSRTIRQAISRWREQD